MNPQYTNEYLANYYSTYIRDESHIAEELRKAHTYCLSLVEKCKPEKGKLLDIGSGNGFLINIARDRGWEPIGHEIDCNSAKEVEKKVNIKMLCGEFSDLNIEEKFDAITMLHVLEHLKQPEKHIQKVSLVMNKGGILFIALPNIHSRSALFKLFLEKIKLKRKNIAAYYDTEHHLFYFSPYSIRNFLEKNGFEIVRIYSGDNIDLSRNAFLNLLDEKILSKLFWHSSMGVIARKL